MIDTYKLDKTSCSVESALEKFLNLIPDEQLEFENINIEDSLSRILYEDILIKKDHPPYDKALVDGYAVKAADISQATSAKPALLKIVEEINAETNKRPALFEKQAIKISKGAFLPENADAVISLADTIKEKEYVKVLKSTCPGSYVAKKGEDLRAEEVFIKKNRKLRPQDIGGIMGIGYRQVKVYKKPVVSIIPTGSELVPIDVEPEVSQIISSNGYVLKGFTDQLGGNARVSSIVKDDLNQVKSAISKALEVSDLVLISGGCSSGSRDYTLKAIKSLENSIVIADEVEMRPGSHILLAFVNNKPVIGLPGNPVSNMTSFHVFAKPVLQKLAGTPRSFWQGRKDTIKLDAFLAKKIASPEGKEDYVRVRLLEDKEGKISAYPYTGQSSFLSTLVKSHGIIKIPAECTGLYEGDRVEVLLF